MKFGDVLRELLEEREITQKQLAQELCLSVSTIGNYVNNQREPDYAILKRIADFFRVTVDYLLDHTAADASISHAELRLLQCYRKMNRSAQAALIEQAAVLAAHFPQE